jgi:hypothetical protein
MEDRHTIRVADIECISLTVIVWLKPRWAQSARFGEIILATLSLAKVSPSRQSTNRFARTRERRLVATIERRPATSSLSPRA